MTTWQELFDKCDEQRAAIDRFLGNGPAVSCKPNFTLLPLRYAAVTGESKVLEALPKLPDHLRRPETVRKLAQSTYAVRPLREGFLYLLAKRQGSYQWEGQFRVDELGALTFVTAEQPWEPPASSLGFGGGKYWSIALRDLDGLDELRVLFSPDPLTPAMLDKYRALPTHRDTMQRFDVRQLAYSCPVASDSVLTRHQFDLIADMAAETQPALATLLDSQAFARTRAPLVALRAEMAPSNGQSQDRGFALVLDDPLGITQELNAWRNHSVQTLEDFLARSEPGDDKGVNNQRKLTIAFGIDNLKKTLDDRDEAEYQQRLHPEPIRGGPDPDLQATLDALAKMPKRNTWQTDYAKYVDEDRLDAFRAAYQKAVDQADATKEARADDHQAWLTSTRLHDALLAYDKNHTEQAVCFEYQLGAAMVGMNATQAGNDQLTAWCENPGSANNLLWRALAQNQEAIEAEHLTLWNQRSQLIGYSESQINDTLKNLATVHDNAHSYVEAVEAAHAQHGPGTARLSGAVLLSNTVGNLLIQSKLMSLADNPVNWVMALVLKGRLGRFAEQMHLEARGGIPLSNKVKKDIHKNASDSFAKALRNGVKGPMAELRLASVLTLLEAYNLKIKVEKVDKASREYVELTAALMAVSAAGLELGGAAVGLAERSANVAVRRAGTIFRSGLRLNAGVLFGSAAFVGAALDYKDAKQAQSFSLAGVYYLRATMQLGVGALSIGLGLAYGAPYISYLAERHGTRWLVLRPAARIAARLATSMIPMLRWGFRGNAYILTVSLVIEAIRPNDLQDFLSQSTYRKDRKQSAYDSEESEVKKFVSAVEATL